MKTDNLKIVAEAIKKNKSVLIFSHNRPDGDTVGSACALKLALLSLGINAELVCDSDIPEKFLILNGAGDYKKPIDYAGMKFDAHISVDCSTESMFSGAYLLYASCKNTINVDHHVSDTYYAALNYVEKRSACCEIVYELILNLGVKITVDIANALLFGIITDSGNFAHSDVTYKTLLIASELVKTGGDIHTIIEKSFRDQSRERAALFARAVSGMQYFLDDRVAVILITKKDIAECNAKDNMTEGIIDFPMTVRTVEVAISLLETGNRQYKISLRSRGKVNVNEIASLYGGGGHILASGAMMRGYPEDITDKLVYNVKQRL